MASNIVPLITFKAGRCDDATGSSGDNPISIKCKPTPGYVYVYTGAEDELTHFCWRPRTQGLDDPELDLIMFPGDARFLPYVGRDGPLYGPNVTSPTSGRIYVLKFSSSSQRHLFWLQSKSQHPDGNKNWFSRRDQKLGQVVDLMLQGEEVDVDNHVGNERGNDEDHDMDDAPGGNDTRPSGRRESTTGGAGADATGGDIRDEGSGARDGGADGGRAASDAAADTGAASTDASTLVQNLLSSLGQPSGSAGGRGQQRVQNGFCSLSDLLTPETCIPVLSASSDEFLDSLLNQLPGPLILLETLTSDDTVDDMDTSPDVVEAVIMSLAREQKVRILTRVVRSAQFQQSLGSLTVAIRDGGLPSVAEALGVKVANGGYMRGSAVPLGGGDAVEAFVEGVKTTVAEHKDDDEMDIE
ncbi:hypothetical protein BT63DRAFT_422494 [Microthyrium microscopicum]|uniref:Pru domain-containing protein n=1 Tax=Microthyrium microscopicum TaxID=703497 RepID=A0A6A6UKD3_9PEZI|nr:hypothetical protein BT63DRAFT_422494 [Microthyrium microscopicum]